MCNKLSKYVTSPTLLRKFQFSSCKQKVVSAEVEDLSQKLPHQGNLRTLNLILTVIYCDESDSHTTPCFYPAASVEIFM